MVVTGVDTGDVSLTGASGARRAWWGRGWCLSHTAHGISQPST